MSDSKRLADVDFDALVKGAEASEGVMPEDIPNDVPPSRRRKTNRPYSRSGRRYQGKAAAQAQGDSETLPPLLDDSVTDLLEKLPPEDLNKIVLEGMGGALRGLTKLLAKLIGEGMEADETESMLYARYIKAYLMSMPNVAELLNNPKTLLWLVGLNYAARRLDVLYAFGEKVVAKRKRENVDTYGQS